MTSVFLPFDLELTNALEYKGVSPFETRTKIVAAGKENQGKLVALMVACRGTNIFKIVTKAKDPALSTKIVAISEELSREFAVSLAHIASAFPEVVYDTRIKISSSISVNTLAFLKHNGLTHEKWLLANEEFCKLVGLDFAKFLAVEEVIWKDDSFEKIVGARKPL
ncbi:nucleocapsid [Leptomonas moramango virus]|uniref:Nucleocapsid n=1 Tax=Leptomonas moramango virus TaxID=1859148 RepID=A0A191Z2Z3_9VIRU|nr:nucleocapsid [Leptomonas moramango virus]ANJ59512.1 nucleocapsid [Leptomonas moramango virus]